MNSSQNVVITEEKNGILYIFLNKPEKHNSLDNTLISELIVTFRTYEKSAIRLVVLRGKGKSFCAGADLQWMKEVINYDFQDNLRESNELAELLYTINKYPKPVIAVVNGAAIGGGAGLMSACDFVIAEESAKIGFTEVRLGLAPAVIAPFVISRIGFAKAKEFFLTGELITAQIALEIGLINKVVQRNDLEDELNKIIDNIIANSPNALKKIKELIYNLYFDEKINIRDYTVDLIANLRISEEGQEGMNSFFEKRKPYWQK